MNSRALATSICCLLFTALAPNAGAQISPKLGNTTGETSDSPAAGEQAPKNSSAELKGKIILLQETILKATEQLRNAAQSSVEQTKALDELAVQVQVALKEVSANGEGKYDELVRRIKETDSKVKMWQDKSLDTKISGEMHQRYNALSMKLAKSKDDLYKNQISLDIQRNELQKQMASITENKEYVVALLAANDLDEANKAVQAVVQSMNSVSKSFEDLLSKVTASDTAEKAQ
jgi:hypothetical protein